jgi:hypothetical protein
MIGLVGSGCVVVTAPVVVRPPLPVARTLNAPAEASRFSLAPAGTVSPAGQMRYGAAAAVHVVVLPLARVPQTGVPAVGTLTLNVNVAVAEPPPAPVTVVDAVYGLSAAVGVVDRT